MRRPAPNTIGAGLLAGLAGTAVFIIASVIFSHHSINHDEGVYLFQATLLLEGSFVWELGELSSAFRPWFFVEDGDRQYPKYAPVPAGLYAVGMLVAGEPRVTLAVVAAANTFLVYLLGRRVFDARVGLIASGCFAASPLMLVSSSVFLPYAPTTMFTLGFAVAYLRAMDERSRVAAVAAGGAIGLAFFARPFTALLFSLPFIAHALYRVMRAVSRRRYAAVVPEILTGITGLIFVLLTLGYNRLVTGDALTFPYEAFAPLDGPGFGTRRMLGHAIEYTPSLALRANATVLWQFGTRWFAAGLIGALLALSGVLIAVSRWSRGETVLARETEHPTGGWLVGGLLVTVPAGNVLFWGNVNILGATPRDGMLGHLGPFYHFDMLVPLSLFAALAIVVGWEHVTRIRRATEGRRLVTSVMLVGLVISGLFGGALVVGAVAEPLERNQAYTERQAAVYAPIDAADLDDALVFIPTPYGDWQQHPFQYLRNDPDFDGTVYALDRDVASDFAVIEAFPDRSLYRFTYRGDWPPRDDPVIPKLESLERERGESFAGQTVVGVPPNVDHAMVDLTSGRGESHEYTVESPDEEIAVDWSLSGEGVALDGTPNREPLDIDGAEQLSLTVTLVQPDGATLTYRQDIDIRHEGGTIEVIWPPRETVCPLVTACGTSGTYLPGEEDAHRDGVWVERSLSTVS